MFSPPCQYAIRALVYLARHEGEGPVLARDIAGSEDIPKSFLSKILHQLGQRGLVRSQKGPGGGFALARPARQVTVADIAAAVDGVPDVTHRCLLGMPECSDATSCALHDAWKKFRSDYDRSIGALTLATLAAAPERGGWSDAPTPAADDSPSAPSSNVPDRPGTLPPRPEPR